MIAVIKLKTFDIELSVNENGLDGYEKPKRAHTANTMNIPHRETIADLDRLPGVIHCLRHMQNQERCFAVEHGLIEVSRK